MNKNFTENQLIRFLGRLGNKWGTGHDSVSTILRKTKEFIAQKKDKIQFLEKVVILLEMLEAHSEGKYEIDDGSLGLIISALAYLVLPTDLIPDMIVGIGFADDLYAFKLVFDQLSFEIESFKSWQKEELSKIDKASVED
ncbi:MAG: YkvA family protein [Bacillota bacterium]